jgi:hypothetical protein
MTNTQRLDQMVPPLDPVCELAAATMTVARQTRRVLADLWLGLMQWG